MRLLFLHCLFAFVSVCQNPWTVLSSFGLNQFGEKDGGHRDPEFPLTAGGKKS